MNTARCSLKLLILLVCSLTFIYGLPQPESSVNEDHTKYLFVGHEAVNWWQAKAACLKRNMQLVSIETELEQKKLSELLVKALIKPNKVGYIIWTSVNNFTTENPYQLVWSSTGQSVSYTNWALNEPDRRQSGDKCVAISNFQYVPEFQWAVGRCEWTLPYICEYKDDGKADVSITDSRDFILSDTDLNKAVVTTDVNGVAQKRYFIEDQKSLSWFDAKAACSQMNMTLLSLESSSEQQQLEDYLDKVLIKAVYRFWTSGYRQSSQDPKIDFTWDDSGRPLSFTNWKGKHKPVLDGKEKCVMIRYVDEAPWLQSTCEEARPFICENREINI